MQQALLQLLNIRPHESRLVKQLFIVQFLLVIGTSFLFIIANAIFLSQYHIIELPKAFFITGIFLLLFNRLYSKAEHLLTTRHLLFGIILFSIALTLLMRIGLIFPELTWMPYILLIGYNIIYLVTGLIFWGVAAMLFNVRESKRLFTIIGAGDIPAKLIGYLLVSFLAPFIGLDNMIWIAVAAFIIALPFAWQMFNMQQITALERQHHEHGFSHPVQNKLHKVKKIFGADLILTISILSLITFAVLILIDFTFLAEVKVKYHTDIELAYFLGIFFALGRILAVVLKLTLSSRMIARLGLAWSLLLSPITLLILIIIILFVSFTQNFQSFIYLFGIMALLTEILKSIIQEPIFLVLFQPLKQSLRLKGHVIAKGYMLGLAMIIIGGSLVLYLSNVLVLSASLFSYVLAGILVLWIGSVFLVKKEYLKTLYEAIKGGFFRGNELFLQDESISNLLLQKTESKKPLEVISALDLLERSGYEKMDQLFLTQLKKKDQAILKYTLGKIISRKQAGALPEIKALLLMKDKDLNPLCIEALSILDPDSREMLEPYLHSKKKDCRQAAIAGLLKSNDLESFIIAGQQLLNMVHSSNEQERIMSAEIIHDAGENKFYKILYHLLFDESIIVQKKAIAAAGNIKNEQLLEVLVEKLKQPSTTKEAELSLIKHGDNALLYYKKLSSSSQNLLSHFMAIAGGIQSEQAVDFLTENLFTNLSLRTQILNQLWIKKYRAEPSLKRALTELVTDELNHADQIINYSNHLIGKKDSTNLRKALELEVNARIFNTLKALSFMYDRHKINDVMNTISSNDHQISNALEMLEMTIPGNIFRKINFIIEAGLLQKKKPRIKRKEIPIEEILREIIQSKINYFNAWTRAVAIAFVEKLKDPAMISFLKNMELESAEQIIKETRFYVISRAN